MSGARAAGHVSGTAGERGAIELEAPAKINFGLRVTGRREDGYHLLESLFLPLALGDTVRVARRSAPGVSLELADAPAGLPAGQDNLVVRAATAFLEAAGLGGGVALHLVKHIPVAAGLGGGSSDAAAVLRALDQAHPGAVSPEGLRALALGLGADVPFFLDPRPAWVTGIGERVGPLGGVPSLDLLLANPGEGLSTAEVFRAFAASAGPAGSRLASLTPEGADPTFGPLSAGPGGSGSQRARLEAWLAEMGGPPGDPPRGPVEVVPNDLEPSASRLCPAVRVLREEIQETGARAVGLSGSGPTVFGVYADRAAALAAQRALGLEAPARSIVTRTLPSPDEAADETRA